MPQLPSGKLVGLSIDPALNMVKQGHLFFRVIFKVQVKSVADVGQAVSILYFQDKEGVPYPGEEYVSGITLSALGTERCDWPQEDVEYFQQWLTEDRQKQWLQTAYDTLLEAISKSKSTLPENLAGIMDDDD